MFKRSVFLCARLQSCLDVGGRDTSSLRHASSLKGALLGRWVSENGDAHCSFDPASFVLVHGGTSTDTTYIILESDESRNSIKIRVKGRSGVGEDRQIVFSPDRKSFTLTSETERGPLGTRWSYVDSTVAALAVSPKEADAVADIKRLGGTFTVDEKSADTPVIYVDLSHSNVTDGGLPRLKALTQTPIA